MNLYNYLPNIGAFFAGVTFMIALLLTGISVQDNVGAVGNDTIPLFAALFTGLALGHHMGKAVDKGNDKITSAYIGSLVILSSIIVFYTEFDPLSGVLVVMAIAIFLTHVSGLIEDSENIERLIEIFSGDLPPITLIILGIVRYVVPFAIFLGGPENILQWILNPLVVMLSILLGVLIIEYISIRRNMKLVSEHSNIMYDLGQQNAREEKE